MATSIDEPSANAKANANADDDDASQEPEIDNEDIQPMSFNIFVLSLNHSALIHLGDSQGSQEAQGAQGESMVSLPLARQTIDILGLLEAKTRGNLSGEEERLLHQILFDLRMRYSRKVQG